MLVRREISAATRLGTWHDGSPEGEVLMQARYEQKLKRMNNPRA
jgi:hypothetical protein